MKLSIHNVAGIYCAVFRTRAGYIRYKSGTNRAQLIHAIIREAYNN